MNNTDLRDTKIQDIEIIKLSLQKKRKKKKLSVVRLKYHTTMFFTQHLLAIGIKKSQMQYQFWYNHLKLKYIEKAMLSHLDTDTFIVYIKTDDIYKDINEDVESIFDTSNYELNGLLRKGKNKKLIELMKDGLGGKIITKFVD